MSTQKEIVQSLQKQTSLLVKKMKDMSLADAKKATQDLQKEISDLILEHGWNEDSWQHHHLSESIQSLENSWQHLNLVNSIQLLENSLDAKSPQPVEDVKVTQEPVQSENLLTDHSAGNDDVPYHAGHATVWAFTVLGFLVFSVIVLANSFVSFSSQDTAEPPAPVSTPDCTYSEDGSASLCYGSKK